MPPPRDRHKPLFVQIGIVRIFGYFECERFAPRSAFWALLRASRKSCHSAGLPPIERIAKAGIMKCIYLRQ